MITPSLYQTVSDHFNIIIHRREESLSHHDNLINNFKKISDMCFSTTSMDLLNVDLNDVLDFRTNYGNIYVFMEALQQHVIQKSGYDNINDWLLDNSVLVGESFARLSGVVGFPIDEENIR